MKSTRSESFDAMLDEGYDICIGFNRITKWSIDNSYGADADGNRGISVTEIDEDYAEGITVSWDDEPTGNAHNDIPLDELPETDRVRVQRLVDEYIEAHPPQEPDSPEPDYDDVGD